MAEESTTSNATEKKKPGPKPKVKVEMMDTPAPLTATMALELELGAAIERIANLENCLSKMAHFTGTNRVLDEFGIDRWEVTKDSMRKVRG